MEIMYSKLGVLKAKLYFYRKKNQPSYFQGKKERKIGKCVELVRLGSGKLYFLKFL